MKRRYLRAPDIARELGVSVRTVRRWISSRTLPSVKIGGTRLVEEVDLLERLRPK
jgi:excisionase family DNA binding protein